MSNFVYLIAADAIHTGLVVTFAVLYRSTAKQYGDGMLGLPKKVARDD